MRLSRESLLREAAATGFRPEVLEKVFLLLDLLEAINGHPGLSGKLALKGGTALNLFLFDAPRLSVDIDLNYVGAEERDIMRADRSPVEQAIELIARRLGLAPQTPKKEEHAGRSWVLRYASALGGTDNLKIDLIYTLAAALLRSRPAELRTPAARAYAAGEPYDPARLPLFEALFSALRAGTWPDRPDAAAPQPAFGHAAFFDAYFSNYIEGTDFPVEQALRIVFQGEIPASRPADAHDVLGTYRLVASQAEMRRRPADFDGFLALLKGRHGTVMEGRPEKGPGRFKEVNNQAGATTFVAPELVVGTLRQGFGMYRALDSAFARALFVMFLVAEVHPFADGNGRVARVMMNAELLAGGQTRIIIPSVFRTEYVGSLKRLTNYRDPAAFVRVMEYAQDFVSRIGFEDLEAARRTLAACEAFRDPADDVKLRMPLDRPA